MPGWHGECGTVSPLVKNQAAAGLLPSDSDAHRKYSAPATADFKLPTEVPDAEGADVGAAGLASVCH